MGMPVAIEPSHLGIERLCGSYRGRIYIELGNLFCKLQILIIANVNLTAKSILAGR